MGRWFCLCVALAAGEAVGLVSGGYSFLWPLSLALALFTVLFGYGYAVRGWPLLAVALLGFALAGRFADGREELYRDKFWMRGKMEYLQRRHVDDATVKGLPGIKSDLSRRVGIGLEHSPDMAALNRAILLGERGRLKSDVKKVFVESGTMHIFAISGLHVMILAQVLLVLLRVAMCPYRIAAALVIPLLWLYAAVVGFPPSAVRAVSMASLYFGAVLFFRKPNGCVAWAQTFLAVHVISPEMLFNTGSLLSFAVMLGILGCGRLGIRGNLKGMLFVTIAAWLAGMPIAAHVFGRITPGGLLANIVLIPAAWYAVFSGALGVLLSFLSVALAAHFNNFAALVTEAMAFVAETVSKIPGANFEIRRWTIWECFAWYAVLGLSMWLFRSIQKRKLF